MGKITVLPDTLCNQIAAGEVVERPAAVVKELMENSIDAVGRRISVALLQGGRKEIRVVDNGSGMSSEDALLALERHATSKIRSVEDLQAIQSLGFRGEALPSIAAVSRFELVTREPAAVSGTRVRMEGGVLKDVRETGCPPGTLIVVRDLFYNIPARRKFLRSIETEMAHISDQFLRLAMGHPEIHLQLSHHERTLYDFTQVKGTPERAAQILGMDLTAKLRAFSAQTPTVKVHGVAGSPDLQRANSQFFFVYVNGRPVWDRMLNHAVLSAYENLIPKGKYPVVILFVEISPVLVDVNVHPTKREVRFRSPGEILETLRGAVRTALESIAMRGPVARSSFASEPVARAPLEQSTLEQSPPARGGSYEAKGVGNVRESFSPAAREYSREGQVPLAEKPATAAQHSVLSTQHYPERFPGEEDVFRTEAGPGSDARFSRLRVLGQLANTYILLEAPDGLVLIDQHAAHERIVYNQLTSESGREPAQRLVQSVVLNLLPTEAARLNRWLGRLAEIGFEIEPFGGESFLVHSVPALLSHYSPELFVRELLQSAHEEESAPKWDLMAELAKTAACHSAIRAGQKLRPEEIRSLLETLDRTPIPATCPHGRPLWFKLTHAEIARYFQRT